MSFDLEHVEKALAYFADPDEQVLLQIAESRATEHLLIHSERTGYYRPGTSGLELTRILLGNPGPEGGRPAKVKALVSYVRANPGRQTACVEEAKKYLPNRFGFGNPLFVTWGYDIGVAMDGSASLNLAHDHFLEDENEVWFFCIHEMHHAGVTSLHPMVKISQIATTQQLFSFLRYSTFLEGTATYAAYEARAQAGALARDRDYVALTDEARMDRYRARYFELYEKMKSAPDRRLEDVDWQTLEDFSDGDRLWYRVGAAMAATIDKKLGQEKFKEVIAEGPDAFFDAYLAL
ncbi:MAG: DUF5700 domain-containing putative Zn-dependent protease [Thermoanaerobaculia bacterium]